MGQCGHPHQKNNCIASLVPRLVHPHTRTWERGYCIVSKNNTLGKNNEVPEIKLPQFNILQSCKVKLKFEITIWTMIANGEGSGRLHVECSP